MKTYDCVVCGEACVDLLIRPIPRDQPLNQFNTQHIEAIQTLAGGIVPNSATGMSRLGLKTAALCLVGNDAWGDFLRRQLTAATVDTEHVLTHESAASSVTAVLVDEAGEHTFAFHAGASQMIEKSTYLNRLSLFASSSYALFGYYHLMPRLEDDLAEVLEAVRQTGCKTALDTANGGGHLQPLDRILPHVDIYIPSFAEAEQQTGQSTPRAQIETYRDCGTSALLGIKLGKHGALLQNADREWLEVAPISPPGPIVDTTGAGDSFYAGLITGLVRGMPLGEAVKIGAAAGACCVTALGTAGIRNLAETKQLAGL
ncbi:MAG: carbohydrate kinase family protein [Pirellulaceae bacterium]|nr:carbohydrate kinase family protein [Pirellulaceae bacterium]